MDQLDGVHAMALSTSLENWTSHSTWLKRLYIYVHVKSKFIVGIRGSMWGQFNDAQEEETIRYEEVKVLKFVMTSRQTIIDERLCQDG